MRLDAFAFGLAAGVTAAVLFVVCALAVAIAPDATTTLAGNLIHLDVSGMTRTLTFGNFLGGLAAWWVGTTLTCWLVGTIYNRLAGRTYTAGLSAPQPGIRHG
jgi:hypothetical protein